MVSLRERKERVSYSNIPEGLEDLSSSEEGRGSAGGEDGGNGSGDESGASGSGNSSGDEEEGSLSSGDSSEFNPEEEDDDRPKRGRPKGGKNRPRAQESSEDEDMDEEGVSEDEESEVEELKEIEELDEEMGSLRKGSQTSRKSKGRVSILSRQQAGPTVYQKSEINLVPSAYRNLIKLSATTLAKLPAQRPPVPPHDQRYRSLGSLVFPSGGTVPWLTRLASSPDGRKSEIKFVDDKGDKGKRREIEVKVYKRTTLDIPWEAWKGEGWWPEMYDASGASTPGPSRIKGWRMREEVRLGLDEVGRVGMEALDIISEVDAELYLPTPMDREGNPWTTVHLGPHDQQVPVHLTMFSSRRIDEFNTAKEGYVFSAGGPIWGLDWCPYPDNLAEHFGYEQYIAISPLPHIETQPALGEKWPRSSKAGIQIWSVDPPSSPARPRADDTTPREGREGMRCELVLCVEGGSAMEVQWMPLGAWDDFDFHGLDQSRIPKLGILAAVQLDGSVSLYAVPHPRVIRRILGDWAEGSDKPLFVRSETPLLRLEVADASCTTIDWVTGSKLAVGLSDGHAVIWDVGEALRTGHPDPLPCLYLTLSNASIRSIAVSRCPPADADGDPQWGAEPTRLVYGAYDGSFGIVDLRDPDYPIELNRSRVPCMAVGWAPQMASPLFIDVDYVLMMRKISGILLGRNHSLVSHRGPVWSISTSDYHTMTVTAGSDGSVLLGSYQAGFRRDRKAPLLFHRLFEMDYDVETGEYRMTDDFMPETMSVEMAGRRPKKKAVDAALDPTVVKTAAWSPHAM
ncbi:hypothetical protein EHS25_009108 [Saitozyma podzolica]|uniref:Uncharacterized protein n=1 Tax=Saitozyma podzolica TaxID=1890683 RepID=A0A427YKZ6_9TREE|nr:hypothetical protein EHS25_009108 [Saitozyma podzolica]